MLQRPQSAHAPRHARLFELLRQRNLAEIASSRQPRPTAPVHTDAFDFIRQAEASLEPDSPRIATL